ncbi:MAG: hypothetical protein IT196_09575 [Acidimicrobiales bacterium]|nr:hypothetical protein [Acidimicrobiales bacterium]
MPTETPDTETTVRTMFALAGVTPPEEEMAAFIAGYPATRAALDALYAVPDTPLTDGILVFRPAD